MSPSDFVSDTVPKTANRERLITLIGAALAGGAAAILILAAVLPFYLLFKVDYAPTLASNAIIERTPPDNAIALQNALGPLSFPFALLGGVMIIGMLGFPAGLVYGLLRRFSLPLAMIGGSLMMVGLAFAFFPDHMTVFALVPLLLTGPLIGRLTRRDQIRTEERSGINRRELLRRAAIFSVGGLAVSIIDGFPVFLAALNAAKPGARLFAYSPPAPRKAEFPAPGSLSEVTTAEDFYVMRKFPTVVPPVSPDFRLVIDGLVNTPQRISLDELFAMPRHDVYITRQCVSNPVGGSLMSTAYFSGVPLKTLLEKAGIQGAAIQLKFYGRDGYEESVPITYALEHGLIAYALNGTTLSEAHGAPLKIEVPGLYGFKNMKWLTRIEAIREPFKSVWAREGWTETATYKTMSRTDAIRANPDGGTTICGVAFAGLFSISRVEVQINGGAWQVATLHMPPLNYQTWVQWRLDVPERGSLTVAVRATDGTGETQIETKQPQFPNGATGLHTVSVTV